MTDALAWIDARRPAAPPSLRAAMARALDGAGATGGALEDQLAAAGLAALRTVLESRGDRSAASDLLAADALLTYACEAGAEAGPSALERLAAALSPERLSALLEPGSS